jgi:hypothetical protein
LAWTILLLGAALFGIIYAMRNLPPCSPGDDPLRMMEFHDFPAIYRVSKQNGLVEDPPDRFYVLRLKAQQVP